MTVHTPPPKKPSQVLFGEMERKGREVNRLPDGRRGRSRARGGFSQRGHAAGLVGWAAVVASGHWAAGGKLGHPLEEGSRVVEEGSGSCRRDQAPGGRITVLEEGSRVRATLPTQHNRVGASRLLRAPPRWYVTSAGLRSGAHPSRAHKSRPSSRYR